MVHRGTSGESIHPPLEDVGLTYWCRGSLSVGSDGKSGFLNVVSNGLPTWGPFSDVSETFVRVLTNLFLNVSGLLLQGQYQVFTHESDLHRTGNRDVIGAKRFSPLRSPTGPVPEENGPRFFPCRRTFSGSLTTVPTLLSSFSPVVIPSSVSLKYHESLMVRYPLVFSFLHCLLWFES